ncbi:MAG: hypothetical protein JWM98_930 [Thermoleophilia bacterium]|nr:hypothetical protein [Thermoleophilia bacterium]
MITQITSTTGTPNRNSGIVPPWLDGADRAKNPGIVPPWLDGADRATNPGVVPPWLLNPIHILPIDEAEAASLPAGDTRFVHTSADVSPISLADALRGR